MKASTLDLTQSSTTPKQAREYYMSSSNPTKFQPSESSPCNTTFEEILLISSNPTLPNPTPRRNPILKNLVPRSTPSPSTKNRSTTHENNEKDRMTSYLALPCISYHDPRHQPWTPHITSKPWISEHLRCARKGKFLPTWW